MANLPDRVATLETALADLAEIVGYGRAGHVSAPGENPALKIAAQFRPQPDPDPSTPEVEEFCLKARKPGDEDSEVCLKAKGHDKGAAPDGHMYGSRPHVAAQAP